jgi:hypothetical protein
LYFLINQSVIDYLSTKRESSSGLSETGSCDIENMLVDGNDQTNTKPKQTNFIYTSKISQNDLSSLGNDSPPPRYQDKNNYQIEKDSSESNNTNYLSCFMNSNKPDKLKHNIRPSSYFAENEQLGSFFKRLFQRRPKYTRLSFYRNNLSLFLCILSYIVLQIILAIVQYSIYSNTNMFVRIARIGGILLDFNSSLIILLVLRRLVTWIRNSFIGRYLPMDDFIKFHKFIGVFIMIYSVIHTVAHCINLCKINFQSFIF